MPLFFPLKIVRIVYMSTDNFQEIDKKQQARWEKENLFASPRLPKGKKFYCLDMFPYPSGAGLHVGHPEGYTASDILTRPKIQPMRSGKMH